MQRNVLTTVQRDHSPAAGSIYGHTWTVNIEKTSNCQRSSYYRIDISQTH